MARDDNTEARVCTLITEHLSCADRFAWDSELKRDLGADSLDTIELTMAAEEAFDIEIDDHTAERWNTPGDMLASVQERVS